MTGKGSLFFKETKDLKALMNVALGKEKADLAVVNAKVVNVYTGEIIENCSICIMGKWIAYVGLNPKDMIGPKTEIIDAGGKTVIPGLIDGHAHLVWLFTAGEFLKYAIKGGTTTIVTETLEIYPVAGYPGLIDFLESYRDQPIKILSSAPGMVSISHAARGISNETLQQLLDRDDVIGLGEAYWQGVLQEPDLFLPYYEQTLLAGKLIEGHAAGASEKKLAAYAAAGVSSCHEPTDARQALDRLRMGFHTMIREGSIRRELEEIAKIKDKGIDLRHLILVTDGLEPTDLMEKGHMEFIVQKAIDCGFDPMAAIQMATLNPAEHFRLDGLIGGIAPGRHADLVIIPDIQTIDAQVVISDGRIIVQNGRLLGSPRKHTFSESSLNTIHLAKDLRPSDFVITPASGAERVRVRVIDMVTDLVTAELEMEFPVLDGRLSSDANKDILKIAAVDRGHHPGKIYVGLIRGFCLKSGAVACSAAWDTSDIIVIGADDADMAVAVNRIRALQGAAVVCDNGEILAELPMPVFGIISNLPMETIALRLQEIKKAMSNRGVQFPDPLLTLITLTAAAIPYLRICEEGLVNLKDGKTQGLFVD